jgi:hypothetical protein
MSMSVSLDCPFLIDIHKKKTLEMGQSRDTHIDIQKKKTLEMGQSGMGNLETLTVTYT